MVVSEWDREHQKPRGGRERSPVLGKAEQEGSERWDALCALGRAEALSSRGGRKSITGRRNSMHEGTKAGKPGDIKSLQ